MPYNSLVTRSDAAAMVPEQVSQAMLTNLEAQSVALQAGTRIPVSRNQVRFPVLSALPVAYFVTGDTGLKQTSEAAWANAYLDIEEIATIVPIPEAVLDDAGFDIWGYLQPLMEAAISRKLDAAIFFGASAPAAWPDDIVTAAVAAGNVYARGTNAAAAGGIYGDLSELLGTLEADGLVADTAIANVTVKKRLRNARSTTGEQLKLIDTVADDLPDFVFALPGLWPTGTNAAEVIVGMGASLVVGVRQDMTYKLLTEAVITDAAGLVVYNLPQQDMVALRLVFRAGWAVANPINYQEGTEANRYPWAVLRSPAS